MDYRELIEYQWPYLLSFLGADEPLDDSAKRFGALTRKRRVDSADKLLRLALAYGFCGLSLRQTAAWAETAGIASLSDVALLNRFRKASDWLGHLVAAKLAERGGSRPQHPLQLVLVDASTICAPGNTGTDWRLHLGFDLASFTISDVKLTDFRGGESLKRYRVSPGDVLVGDRGYSRRTDLASVVQRHGDFIVRLNWAVVPLTDLDGGPFDIVDAVRTIPEAAVREFNLRLKPDRQRSVPDLPVRVVAVRKSEAAAAESRKKLLKLASKKQTTPDPRALEMAAYVIVITSLSSDRLRAADVLEIYRFRWQVELVFKRLKSLLDLDGLPGKDPDLARTFIYSKVLAALLLDDFTQAFVSFSPWGFNIR
jgi:hypothetical protein